MYWIIFTAVTSHGVGECNVQSKTAEFMKTIAALMNYGRAQTGNKKCKCRGRALAQSAANITITPRSKERTCRPQYEGQKEITVTWLLVAWLLQFCDETVTIKSNNNGVNKVTTIHKNNQRHKTRNRTAAHSLT